MVLLVGGFIAQKERWGGKKSTLTAPGASGRIQKFSGLGATWSCPESPRRWREADVQSTPYPQPDTMAPELRKRKSKRRCSIIRPVFTFEMLIN